MKLNDLTPVAQRILRTLYLSGSGIRRSELVNALVAEEPEMEPIPEEPAKAAKSAKAAKQEPEPEPEEPEEPIPEVAEPLLNAMEIELALDRLRHQLRTGHIPARTACIYREIVSALPPVLAQALEPITEWVEAAP